jgi:hypothetical protein
MKKSMLFIAGMLVFASVASAITPPGAVRKTFEAKFPGATSVKWDKENAHEYEASFTWNGNSYSANFNDSGAWLETEGAISFNQLPAKVQNTFNTKHEGAKVKAVAKIETSAGDTKYEVEVRQKMKTVEYFYNSEGVEIKK